MRRLPVSRILIVTGLISSPESEARDGNLALSIAAITIAEISFAEAIKQQREISSGLGNVGRLPYSHDALLTTSLRSFGPVAPGNVCETCVIIVFIDALAVTALFRAARSAELIGRRNLTVIG